MTRSTFGTLRVLVFFNYAVWIHAAIPSPSKGLEVIVDNYGAVGDGVTYDHNSIIQAITAAGDGGTVNSSSGKTYNICKEIYPRAGQTLRGNGATLKRCDSIQTHLLSDANQGDTTIQVDDPTYWLLDSRIILVLSASWM